MFRCTDCNKEYEVNPGYCDCGNDQFEEIIDSVPSQQYDDGYSDGYDDGSYETTDTTITMTAIMTVMPTTDTEITMHNINNPIRTNSINNHTNSLMDIKRLNKRNLCQ